MFGPPNRSGTFERVTLWSAFIVYLLFQINAAFHHGSWGQDFGDHVRLVQEMLANPREILTGSGRLQTDPPLVYTIAWAVFKLTGGVHWLDVLALLYVAVNTVALLLLYRILRQLIVNTFIRLACLLFFMFLPFAMIHSEVFAADGLATPVFVAFLYLLLQLSDRQSGRQFIRCALTIALLLALGLAIKYTFASQAAAVLICIWLLNRSAMLSRARALRAAAVTGVIAGAAALASYALLAHAHRNTFNINIRTGEMSLRDILFFRRHDAEILNAPSYDARDSKGQYNLLVKDRFSYPALVHLGIFTDMMNVYQYDPTDAPFATRSPSHRKRMRLAVKTGLLFSLALIVITPIVFALSLYRTLVRRDPAMSNLAITGICGLLWFLNIAVFLPFVPAYPMGYWLPRLILPAILGFSILTAAGLDLYLRDKSPIWPRVTFVFVLFQSVVHLSFLWPWGVMKPYWPNP